MRLDESKLTSEERIIRRLNVVLFFMMIGGFMDLVQFLLNWWKG